MLPQGDHTPADYQLALPDWLELVKRPLRRVIYPAYNALCSPSLARRYQMEDFRPDLWLRGQRGNDYERHRRRVSEFLQIRGSRIMIAGCGTGRDMESWLRFMPRRLDGIDWFSYERAWGLWRKRFLKTVPEVEVRFGQANLIKLSEFHDGCFDAVCSDALFEHINDLPSVLREFRRVLRPGGIVYATFGPLWRSWGGDHVSGYDALTSGYNHLIMDGSAYRNYLDGMGAYRHSEHDGRTWIEHDLFSRLTPRQYLECLRTAGFRRRFVAAIIDPRGEKCLRESRFAKDLLDRFDRLDLLISGMTVIYER